MHCRDIYSNKESAENHIYQRFIHDREWLTWHHKEGEA